MRDHAVGGVRKITSIAVLNIDVLPAANVGTPMGMSAAAAFAQTMWLTAKVMVRSKQKRMHGAHAARQGNLMECIDISRICAGT
jgi:hypothetical protein